MRSMSRILIETIVKRMLTDIKKDPERSIRNVIDMALNFAKGRFQHVFFQAAQTMLQNENSAYYALLRDVAAHVDTRYLLTFGMNVGYNGCTAGAVRIRQNEMELWCRIPWTIQLETNAKTEVHLPTYHAVIQEGEQLGIYTWLLFVQESTAPALELAAAHTDSAFCLFCAPELVTDAFLEEITNQPHVMPVIRWGEEIDEACARLRERELLYSIFYPYTPNDVESVLNGALFQEIPLLSPAMTILTAVPDCPDELRRTIYETVVQTRNAQTCRTILMELDGDMERIDHVISDDTCAIRFDPQGSLRRPDGSVTGETGILFQKSLTQILQTANPADRSGGCQTSPCNFS